MLEQYLLIALIIIFFLLVSFIAYLVISNRQRSLESELMDISEMLGDDGA